MNQLNAFVGHSFASEDHEVVEAFLKFFNLVKGMNIGFAWESAEPAEPKELADKVLGLIKDKNLFIGICTTKEAVIEPVHLSKIIFNKKIFKANEAHFSSKTSDWIIQEIGLAIGRGMDLVLLVEKGLRPPGGLQGNLEYIPFDRHAPEKSFGKLLEMIQALLPKAKIMSAPEATKPAGSEEPPQEVQSNGLEWLEPKQDWTRSDYDLALFRAIVIKDTEREKQISAAYVATEDGQVSGNRESWEARQEQLRLVFGEGGTLSKLRDLAVKYPDNSGVQRSLALGYRHYEDYEKSGQYFMVAAERTPDERNRLLMHRDALLDFARAGRKEEANVVLTKMKSLARDVADGEAIIINALRELKEIESNKDLFCGLIERLLQLYPDDVKARFRLAYTYSEADQDELSLHHYLKIPHQERTAITWNNLGVQFDHFEFAGKSVDAYRTAENLGETLAMSNLARKLLKAGFLKEAQEICNRALQVENYNKNVGYTIQQIKNAPEEEDNKQKEPLARAIPLSEFYRDYGRAAVQNEILEHNGRWRGPDCELHIKIKDGVFLAEGEYEVKRGGLGLAAILGGVPTPPTTTETDKYRIKYNGQTYGLTVKCTVRREEKGKQPVFPSLLSQWQDETQVLMVVSDTLTEIRVYEKRASKDPLFYTLTLLM
jgi:tetratricopeptide (TPR) repeat protein